jgi:hypothetical protein
MTISITLPRIPVSGVTGAGLRRLLPLAESAICAVADAYGVGALVRVALGVVLKAAQISSSPTAGAR